jgi:regulator of ribonuclease activity A
MSEDKDKKSDKKEKDKKSDKKDKSSEDETPEEKAKRKEKKEKDKDKDKDKDKKSDKKEKDKSSEDETPEEKAKRKEKKEKDKGDKKDKDKSDKKDKDKGEESDAKDDDKGEGNGLSLSPLEFQPTCDLFDKYEDSARVPVVSWRNFGGKQQFCGFAVTVKCFEDNSRVKELVATPGNHHVMVIDGGASMSHALMGDQLAELAASNNWAGVIVYGCVRDVAALAKIQLGVLAMGSTPRKSVRRGEGQMDLTVRIGDVVVHPGDHVYADEDGVLVLSPNDVEAEKAEDSSK